MEVVWLCFVSIVWVHFSHKTEKCWFWKSLKYFNVYIIFWQKKYMTSDLIMSHRKMSDFVSFPLLELILAIKLKNLNFESQRNIFWSKKKDLNMSCQSLSDLVWTSLFVLNFSGKSKNRNFKLYWNGLLFFN